MVKKTRKVRWNPIVARLAESSVKVEKVVPASKKKQSSEIRWNPMIAKLADDRVKQANGMNAYDNESLRIKENWATTAYKKRTQEEFKAYIHDLFSTDAPKIKYQNPDSWNVYPTKKKTGEIIDS